MVSEKLTLCIGCSGSTTDRRDAMRRLAANYEDDPIDVIIGDWMSEGNMTVRAGGKADGVSCSSFFSSHLEHARPEDDVCHYESYYILIANNELQVLGMHMNLRFWKLSNPLYRTLQSTESNSPSMREPQTRRSYITW